MTAERAPGSYRILVLAPHGRDAALAVALLSEIGLEALACSSLPMLVKELDAGVGGLLLSEESVRDADMTDLAEWVDTQPAWSDLPIILMTRHGGGPERNPVAMRLSGILGNISFLERPFHPTTMVSLMRVAMRGRGRQYEARERIEAIRQAEEALRQANVTLEQRVEERTARLAEAEAALRQAQKLEAIGQLTGGLAHDFNNLLMVVAGGLEVMDRQKDPARRARIVDGMRQAAERGAKLTRQLLAFSRTKPLRTEPIDLRAQVEDMSTLLDHALQGDVNVEAVMPADLWPVEVDPTELELVILNLCVNARDAMPKGGRIRIEATNVPDMGEAGSVRLVVRDTGTGMSPGVRARAFEPFFTTKDIGKGSGLGLAQVYGFAQQSGGSVVIESAQGEGTAIILTLPRAKSEPLTPALADAPLAQAARPGECILVVEDDNTVAALVTEMLDQLGYAHSRVATAAAALEALGDGRRIDAVFSDVMMPGGVDGVQLARELRRLRPDMPVVLTSGYAAAFAKVVEEERLALLPKPYVTAQLSEALRTALGA